MHDNIIIMPCTSSTVIPMLGSPTYCCYNGFSLLEISDIVYYSHAILNNGKLICVSFKQTNKQTNKQTQRYSESFVATFYA